MEKKKTHYRKVFNSPYLSAADIVEPVNLTIKVVRQEQDQTKKTKDFFNTAYFVEKELRDGEKLKPMVLNVGNSKQVAKFAKSSFIEDWENISVTIYVDKNVRFGRDTTEGLRIKSVQPKLTKEELTPQSERWAGALARYVEDGNFDSILKYVSMSKESMEEMKIQAGETNE